MAHKVHPKAFRLKKIEDWDSSWLAIKKTKKYLEEDFKIRNFLEKKLKDCGLERIEIKRLPSELNIIIFSSRPGLVIGRKGEGIEEIKRIVEKNILRDILLKEKTRLNIEIKGIRDPWTKANLVAQFVAQRIEKRMPFRRVIKQALEKIMQHKEIKGSRIEVAGRLGGIQISRTEWLKEGRLPRQSLRADIDYGTAQAFCSYGVIGVKVWIYKGEKF